MNDSAVAARFSRTSHQAARSRQYHGHPIGRRLRFESLEGRRMLAGLTAESPWVTFSSAQEAADYFVEEAKEEYQDWFGQPRIDRNYDSDLMQNDGLPDDKTYGREVNVDSGDIIETDGRYLFTVHDTSLLTLDTHDELAISNRLRLPIEGGISQLILAEDRLAVVSVAEQSEWPVSGRLLNVPRSKFMVTLLDVGDPNRPEIVDSSRIAGSVITTRAVGQLLYIVTEDRLDLPTPQLIPVDIPQGVSSTQVADYHTNLSPTLRNALPTLFPIRLPLAYTGYAYESEESYVNRISDNILSHILPDVTNSFDSRPLVDATDLYRPLEDAAQLTTVAVFDLAGDSAFPVSSTAVPTGTTDVYATTDSLYLAQATQANRHEHAHETRIWQFNLSSPGDIEFAATGMIPGELIGQLALDEHDNHLRVATIRGRYDESTNQIFVLRQNGQQLEVVGETEPFADNERIFAVRFLDDTAFVATSRQTEPLFSFDLSDHNHPMVVEAQPVSDSTTHLTPIGSDRLLGMGRTDGQGLYPQLSLIAMGNLATPTQLEVLTLSASDVPGWASYRDVTPKYYAQEGLVAIPVTDYRLEEERRETTYEELWVVELLEDSSDEQLAVRGRLTNPARIHRSLVLGDQIYAISSTHITTGTLLDPNVVLQEVSLVAPTTADSFAIGHDETNVTLDVLANDLPALAAGELTITAVSTPDQGGTATIAEGGRSIVYSPATQQFAAERFEYTTTDSAGVTSIDSITVTRPLAVIEDSNDNQLPLLDFVMNESVNEIESAISSRGGTVTINEDGRTARYTPRADFFGFDNLIVRSTDSSGQRLSRTIPVWVVNTNDAPVANPDSITIDEGVTTLVYVLSNDTHAPDPSERLTITSVSPATHGSVQLNERTIYYEPQPGYIGADSFTYTIADGNGGSSSAEVQIEVEEVELTVGIDVAIVDHNDRPLTTALVGEEVTLQVTVQDLRLWGEGVFAAYTDIEFDKTLAQIAGEPTFGPHYTISKWWEGKYPSLDGIGGHSGTRRLGNQPELLFEVPIRLNQPGSLTITAAPADNSYSRTRVFDSYKPIPIAGIEYGQMTLQIIDSLQNPENQLDVNNDGLISAVDVIHVINQLNKAGPTSAADALAQTDLNDAPEGEPAPMFMDVNGNGQISVADALAIINWLNANRVSSNPPQTPTPSPANDLESEGEATSSPSLTGRSSEQQAAVVTSDSLVDTPLPVWPYLGPLPEDELEAWADYRREPHHDVALSELLDELVT